MFQPNMFENHNHHHKSSRGNDDQLDDLLTEDEFDIFENPSGDDDQDPNQCPNKKKSYQIKELESYFKECPHPDDKQRKELGQRLGLDHLQVKFWFQNKRTQMKSQHERCQNTQLRNENEKLREENLRYKESLNNASYPNCGGPAAIGEMPFDEQHSRIENAGLREEIDKISGIAARYHHLPAHGRAGSFDLGVGSHGPESGIPDMFGPDLLRSVSGPSETNKPVVVELAVAGLEELVRMAQVGEPLWIRSTCSTIECFSEDEYLRNFLREIGPKPMGLKSEASRASEIVMMNPINLVEIMMDVNQWSTMFSSIVSRAMMIEVLSTGVAGNYNGALQVMTAEFQVPTPLVPTRETHFVRYCKQHDHGMWAVVDVSLEILRPSFISPCRRRLSGCLIQELPNGYSKVTWLEHVEVNDRVVHDMYRSLVNSGLAFGAKRWVTTLSRQCERLSSAMASNITATDVGAVTTIERRKSMLKLAERMVLSFCSGIGTSTVPTWTTLSGIGADDDVRVMTRQVLDDPCRPPGIVLSAATSFWIPVPPKRVFDFLRDKNSRSEWDILSNGGVVQEVAHTAYGLDPGNCVSLLRVNSPNSSQSNMLILQESCADPTGSYVIYAPVDIVAMNGGDPDYVDLLSSGFAILPDGPGQNMGGIIEFGSGGTLLTVGVQILVDSIPTKKLSAGSVKTVNNLIECTIDRIKSVVVRVQNI